ncbi:MAG: chain-length determining protein [Lactobacillus sp.]|nr:chain-length determining protein [Lactobacillus sp.]
MKNYTVKELTKMAWKSLGAIVICAVIGGGLMGVYVKHKQTTTYTATRNVVITHDLNNIQANSDNPYDTRVNADLNMMPTYSDIAENREISVEAHKLLPKKLQKSYSADEINNAIRSESRPQSLVLLLKAKTNSAKDSVEIVNATARALRTQLPKLQPGAGNVVLLEKATTKSVDSNTTPGMKKYLAAGIALGGLLGILISFITITFKDIARKNGK